jgi:beta-phosphoglucomutase-like phosphatase (HAD superfamily)
MILTCVPPMSMARTFIEFSLPRLEVRRPYSAAAPAPAAASAGDRRAYPGSVALLRKLRERKILMAVVSSTNNCKKVLEVARPFASWPPRRIFRASRLPDT